MSFLYKKENLSILTSPAVEKAVDISGREVSGWASRAEIDRDGEIILAEAWQHSDSTAAFERNPVFCFCHEYKALPIGVVKKLEKTKAGLHFSGIYAKTRTADEVFQFTKETGIASFSVGFIPRNFEDVPTSKLEKAGFDISSLPADKDTIRAYSHVELLEISQVPVPAMRAALIDGKLVKSVQNWENARRIQKVQPELDAAFARFDIEREIKRLSWQEIFEDEKGKMRGKIGAQLLCERITGRLSKELEAAIRKQAKKDKLDAIMEGRTSYRQIDEDISMYFARNKVNLHELLLTYLERVARALR